MGNRCVITTACTDARKSNNIGVYLHWHGGRNSVEGFLAYCKLKEYRSPDTDCYGWARLCQVVGNFFGGSDSIGINRCKNLDCDNYDNGVYIVSDWEIVDRQYNKKSEHERYNLKKILTEINNCQPQSEQLEQSIINNYCHQVSKEMQQLVQKPPTLMSTLQANAQKSKEQFGEPTLSKNINRDNGDIDL